MNRKDEKNRAKARAALHPGWSLLSDCVRNIGQDTEIAGHLAKLYDQGVDYIRSQGSQPKAAGVMGSIAEKAVKIANAQNKEEVNSIKDEISSLCTEIPKMIASAISKIIDAICKIVLGVVTALTVNHVQSIGNFIGGFFQRAPEAVDSLANVLKGGLNGAVDAAAETFKAQLDGGAKGGPS